LTGLASAVWLAATPASAQQSSCTREALHAAAQSYVAAQTAGDPARMNLTDQPRYVEELSGASLSEGILTKAQKIDHHLTIVDPQTCQTFTEVAITDPAHPYVLGTRLKLEADRISEIETFVTDQDDWLFDAENTARYAAAEDWGVMPEAKRSDRTTLIAAANAYLDLFNDPDVEVPWGTPCARLEGGIYTAKGRPDDSCNVGVPAGVEITDRRFIVDEELNAVVALVVFGKNKVPDSHLFRLENGKLRYIHTITVCRSFNCGYPLPAQLRERRQ